MEQLRLFYPLKSSAIGEGEGKTLWYKRKLKQSCIQQSKPKEYTGSNEWTYSQETKKKTEPIIIERL